MSVAKNIEISSSSETSFEDAMQKGIAKMSETVKNIEGAWVKEQKVKVKDGKIVAYVVVMIVSFVVS